MRAPPLAEKQTKPQLFSIAASTALTKRAPTTEPIEPPMKENSKAHATIGMPRSSPFIAINASVSPLFF